MITGLAGVLTAAMMAMIQGVGPQIGFRFMRRDHMRERLMAGVGNVGILNS